MVEDKSIEEIMAEKYIKVGTKYYLATDVQEVLEVRIKSVVPEELKDESS